MNRAELLEAARQAVVDRGAVYAPPVVNFERIACMWSIILDRPVTPAQVGLCMAGLKLARLANDPTHLDSIVDLAGYAACVAEVVSQPGGEAQ